MAVPSSTSGLASQRWLSLHVFYAADADPLLAGCVAPLVRRLRATRLVQRYFFIRYWVEGRHVRLRLLPAAGAPRAVVRDLVVDAVDAFLADNPSADPVPRPGTDEYHRRLFVAEYGQRRWVETYGRTGVMPVRANNTWAEIPYEPEYLRYGGPVGLDLAEAHFEASSDTALRLLTGAQLRRSVRLGQAVTLTLAMCRAFLDDDARVAGFLRRYRDSWEAAFGGGGAAVHAGYDELYRRMADRLRRLAGQQRDELGWFGHCRSIRSRLAALVAGGRIQLAGAGTVTDADRAVPALLRSYLHMTNNRLGLTIRDEAYVAHVLHAALRASP